MIKWEYDVKINKGIHEKDKESRNNVRYSVQMIEISLYTLSNHKKYLNVLNKIMFESNN